MNNFFWIYMAAKISKRPKRTQEEYGVFKHLRHVSRALRAIGYLAREPHSAAIVHARAVSIKRRLELVGEPLTPGAEKIIAIASNSSHRLNVSQELKRFVTATLSPLEAKKRADEIRFQLILADSEFKSGPATGEFISRLQADAVQRYEDISRVAIKNALRRLVTKPMPHKKAAKLASDIRRQFKILGREIKPFSREDEFLFHAQLQCGIEYSARNAHAAIEKSVRQARADIGLPEPQERPLSKVAGTKPSRDPG
jgi:hypothetical protein